MKGRGIQNRSYGAIDGFTIVELLIVIVVIGILAAITIVAYNGIKAKADDASLQSEASQLNEKILVYKATNNDALPADATIGGLSVASNHQLYYRVTPDGKNYCLVTSMQDNPAIGYSAVSTQTNIKKGTCEGYILVPGNAAFSTSDFWVMKFEAKGINGKAVSQATGNPWVSISQTDAISASTNACDSCHLISEAEWVTIAANVIGVGTNWSGGSPGNGYIYSGHNDASPSNALIGSTNDSDGYNGTSNANGSQRRTLTLSNGEIIWDMAGNVQEWTQATIAGNAQPGLSGESSYTTKQYNNGSLLWNGYPALGRPANVYSGAGAWSSTQGIGHLLSNYSETGARSFLRGGAWGSNSGAGVLGLNFGAPAYGTSTDIGFRVAR